MIRHILLIKFKSTVTNDEIDLVRRLFESMEQKLEGILAVEWGLNNSPEKLNRGFTHSVLMTFASEAARENYLPHPEHEALKAVFVPLLDEVIVFDYPVL